MDSLKQFLENGALGAIRIGISSDDVKKLLGNPAATGGSRKQPMWKYGSMQLAFYRDKENGAEWVNFIGLYFRNGGFVLPAHVALEGWFPSTNTTKEDVQRYLHAHGVPYCEEPRLTFENQCALTTKSGACIVFDTSAGNAVLDSIQLVGTPTRPQALSPRDLNQAASYVDVLPTQT